jgi:hypothetical protein
VVAGRAVLACALCACLAVAGCGDGGGGEERATPAAGVGGEPPAATPSVDPVTTPQPLEFGRGARAGLAAGGVAVVDLTNRVGIEPVRMAVNSEQRLDGLRWSGWGLARTTGRGRVETLVCEPTCATGQLESSTAVIVLSRPRRCANRRFYTRSSMTYDEPKTGRTRAPDTYLRTPPC